VARPPWIVAMRFAGRPRSRRVIAMLEYLLSSPDGATAYELGRVAGVASNHVYPLLRWWIAKGVVVVTKAGAYNVYGIAEGVRRAFERIMRLVLRSREVAAIRLAERIAETRLWRRLRPAERELIAMLAERLATTSRYLRVRGGNTAEAIDALKAKLEERLRARGASFAEISRVLMELPDAIDELREAGVIYAHWDARNRILVLRLDKSVEEEIARILHQ